MKTFAALVTVSALMIGGTPAFAADQDMNSMSDTHSMQDTSMHKTMGMHKMPATVSAIDATSGIVDLDAEGMKLKVHFPPSSLTSVKAGDKITLHLGFTKP